MKNIWPFHNNNTAEKVLLVHGYEPLGDVQMFERFWLLVEYRGKRRVVEKMTGAIVERQLKTQDMSIAARVRAWQLGGDICDDLCLDLKRFDKEMADEAERL